MVYVNVQGGTGAGRKRPLREKPNDWICPECKARMRYYWPKCPVCGARRPEQERT